MTFNLGIYSMDADTAELLGMEDESCLFLFRRGQRLSAEIVELGEMLERIKGRIEKRASAITHLQVKIEEKEEELMAFLRHEKIIKQLIRDEIRKAPLTPIGVK